MSNLSNIFGIQVTTYILGEGIVSIGDTTFKGCSSLTSITIPNSVTSIGWHAFESCTSLTNFYCYAQTPPRLGYYDFSSSPIENATLHVSANAIEAYKATAPWSGFGTIVALTDEEITQAIDSAKAPSIRIEAHDGNIVAQGAKQAPSFPYIRQTARK